MLEVCPVETKGVEEADPDEATGLLDSGATHAVRARELKDQEVSGSRAGYSRTGDGSSQGNPRGEGLKDRLRFHYLRPKLAKPLFFQLLNQLYRAFASVTTGHPLRTFTLSFPKTGCFTVRRLGVQLTVQPS